tara:strand:- start:189 stop:335 length:147 start_codon:yes stop_codon:yes gene_type:complete
MIINFLKDVGAWYGLGVLFSNIFYSKEFARLIKEAGSGKWRIATDVFD